MSELKFRTWNWLENRYDKQPSAFITIDGKLTPSVNRIIEQYTGLKDKNGKEIYEGDIIHRGALPKVNVFRNSVIRFDDESVGFIATSTRNGARTLFNGHTCDEIEVIGNIHETPELIADALKELCEEEEA